MARPRSITDDELFTRLATVFRTAGYEGASLASLSAAAELRSASLYHRFPGGKEGMAVGVLDEVGRQFADVLDPLTSADDPAAGVEEMARRLAAFYDDGRLSCVLDTMTLAGAPDEVRLRARSLAQAWVDAMRLVAVRSGAGDAEASRRATGAFVSIEGSLVLSRVLGDPAEFTATLDRLPHALTGQTSRTSGA